MLAHKVLVSRKNMSISERLRAEQRLLVSFEHTFLLRRSRKCQAGL